jgi:plastocyanin
VTVTGNRVSPAPTTVDLAVGETITLTVTSDHADELHVHGFDIEQQLPAGRPVSVELTGQSPGVYEVETHEPALRLLKIAVR